MKDPIDHLDPDREHVPAELLALDGRRVRVIDGDGDEEAVVVIVPGVFGHAHRLHDGDDAA